jgi:hypothetical protein
MTSDEIQTVLDTEAYLMIEEAVWKLFKELQLLGFTHTDTVERVCNYVTGVKKHQV